MTRIPEVVVRRSALSRRTFLTTSAAVIIAAPAVLRGGRALAAKSTIKVGHVSPRTGPLAGFAEADDYVLAGIRKIFDGGIDGAGGKVKVQIIAKDSQSTRTAPPRWRPS